MAKTRGPHAASQHHRVRIDRACLRSDARYAAIADEDAHGRRVLEQQGPVPRCAAGQYPCRIQRVHLSVGGHVERAQHALIVHMRPQDGGLIDREQMALDIHPDGVVVGAAQLLHPNIGQREMHASILLVARGLPGLGFKLLEEPRRVFRQFGLWPRSRAADLRSLPRAMSCRRQSSCAPGVRRPRLLALPGDRRSSTRLFRPRSRQLVPWRATTGSSGAIRSIALSRNEPGSRGTRSHRGAFNRRSIGHHSPACVG